jgi:hypothetical protein
VISEPHEGTADASLVRIADHLGSLRFDLTDDPSGLRRHADATARLLRSVAARGADLDAPLLVVIAGGTGAGKSTTVNTLAGERVAAASVVRPTTRAPVLVCHPDDLTAFTGDRVLAGLPRVRGSDDAAGSGQRLVLRTSEGLPPGLAIVDTPDVDSVETANHQLAEDALADADVWLWFVTARTYADEAGARYLRIARDRGVAVGVVVTQLRPADRNEVLADVGRLLADEGVRPDLLTDVPLAEVTGDQLPPDAIAEVRRFVTGLAPPDARAAARRRAMAGVRAAVPKELAPIAAALAEERRAAARLTEAIDAAYAPLGDELAVELEHGIPLRADVLDRWKDLVGGSDALVALQTAAQRVRGAVEGLLGTGGSAPAESPRQVQTEVAGTLTTTLERLLERGRSDARRRLEQDPVGRQLLDADAGLRDDDRGARHDRVRAEVDAWGEHVADLVATVGADRRVRARRWSTALNAVATSAILVVFTVSGGLTGGEVGIAAVASAASQALLVRLFGEQNLRQLLADAHADLDARLDRLVTVDRADLDAAIDAAAPDEDAADAVLAAAAGEAGP